MKIVTYFLASKSINSIAPVSVSFFCNLLQPYCRSCKDMAWESWKGIKLNSAPFCIIILSAWFNGFLFVNFNWYFDVSHLYNPPSLFLLLTSVNAKLSKRFALSIVSWDRLENTNYTRNNVNYIKNKFTTRLTLYLITIQWDIRSWHLRYICQ